MTTNQRIDTGRVEQNHSVGKNRLVQKNFQMLNRVELACGVIALRDVHYRVQINIFRIAVKIKQATAFLHAVAYVRQNWRGLHSTAG